MSFLGPGEKVELATKTSIRYPSLLKWYLLAILLFVGSGYLLLSPLPLLSFVIGGFSGNVILSVSGAGLGILFLIMGFVKRENWGKYTITNYRVVVEKGILGRKMESATYQMVASVKVNQSILEKILGLGDVKITTARGNQEFDLRGVAHTDKIQNIIYKYLESHRPGEAPVQK